MGIKDINFEGGVERFSTIKDSLICSLNTIDFFEVGIYFFIPIAIMLVVLLIYYYKIQFKELLESFYIKRGYIKIYLLTNSKRLKTIFKKLDKYHRFNFKKKSYTLEEMENYIFAYDSKNIPIFLYHIDFIIPFTIESEKITDDIRKKYNYIDDEKKEISAVKMRIDPNILNMVYDKKLLSDLYDSSMTDEFKQKMVYILLGIVGLVILYYTGYLDVILSYLQ